MLQVPVISCSELGLELLLIFKPLHILREDTNLSSSLCNTLYIDGHNFCWMTDEKVNVLLIPMTRDTQI